MKATNINASTSYSKLDPVVCGIICLIMPAIIYVVYRANLFSIMNIDWHLVYNKNPINLLQSFNAENNYDRFWPLNRFVEANLGSLYAVYGDHYNFLVILIKSILIGLLSLSIFGIALIISGSALAGIIAAFLFNFSAASISANWLNATSALMLLPLLVISGGLYSYLRFLISNSRTRWVWFSLFTFLCVVGPWFREYAVVLPAVVLGFELLRLLKTYSPVILFVAILFLHAVFPQILPQMLGAYDPSQLPDYANQTKYMETFFSQFDNVFSEMNWAKFLFGWPAKLTSGNLINEFPPIIWLAIVPIVAIEALNTFRFLFRKGSVWLLVEIKKHQPSHSSTLVGSFNTKTLSGLSRIGAVLSLILLLFFLLGTYIDAKTYLGIDIAPIESTIAVTGFFSAAFLILFIIFGGLRYGVFIPLWFFASFPPLVYLGTNHEAHFSFAFIPMAIIGALYANTLICKIATVRPVVLRRAVTSFALIIGVLVTFDHAANVVSSFLAMKNIKIGHKKIAQSIMTHASKGDLIITNSNQSRDIVYHTVNQGLNFERRLPTVQWRAGIPSKTFLDDIKTTKKAGNRVFYFHLRSWSGDIYAPMPFKFLIEKDRHEIRNFAFEIDPLRLMVNNHLYVRPLTVHEWDPSYGHVNRGNERFVWRSEYVLYELQLERVSELTHEVFEKIKRTSYRHKLNEGGHRRKVWQNRKAVWQTPISSNLPDIGFEILKTQLGKCGFSAKNKTGFGIAAQMDTLHLFARKSVQVTLDISIKSGKAPTFFFSPDPWANTPAFSKLLVNGNQKFVFTPSQTGSFYAVIKVQSGVKTEFSVKKFIIE